LEQVTMARVDQLLAAVDACRIGSHPVRCVTRPF
jgi:hypothetical protein